MSGLLSDPQNKPQLVLVIEPTNKVRFRYASEKGSHGPIAGITSNKQQKTYPTVKLLNYNGTKDVLIRASLYTEDKQKHVLELKGRRSWNGVIYEELDQDFCATFSTLEILNMKQRDAYRILMDRKLADVPESARKRTESGLQSEVKRELKGILNSARLCFEAVLKNKTSTSICPKLFSEPIYNEKATVCNNLRICRRSKVSGSWMGGDEVILLCDKVQKDNIKILFYETDEDGDTVWESEASFKPADVHYQYAITFKTPPYHKNMDKEVFVCLCRNDERSEPVPFLYIADDETLRKRKRSCAVQVQDLSIVENFQNHPSSSSNEASMSSMEESTSQDIDNNNLEDALPIEDLSILMSSFEGEDFESFLNSIKIDDHSFGNLPLSVDSHLGQVDQSENDIQIDGVDDSGAHPNRIFNQSLPIVEMNNLSLSNVLESLNKDSSYAEEFTVKVHDSRKIGKSSLSFKRKLSSYAHLLSKRDEERNNLLHLAVIQGKDATNIIKLCKVINSSIINEHNKSKKTPLHLAVEQNNGQLTELLLLNGGDPSIKDKDGNNCYHIATKKDFDECLRNLFCVNFELFATVNAYNYEGLAPLHIAVQNNSRKCLLFLKLIEVDINIKELKSGRSPLHFAIETEESIVKALLNYDDINVNIQDFEGNTPLHLACANGSTNMVKLLLDAGADPLINNFRQNPQKGNSKECGEKPEDFAGDNYEILDLLRKENSEGKEEGSPYSDYCDYITGTPEVLNTATTEKLYELLNPPSTLWKDFANYAGLGENLITSIEKNYDNPTKALLTCLKNQYGNNFMEVMKNLLEVSGLNAKIVL